MLTSITPLGERGRGQRYGVTLTSYLLGSAGGGAAMGLAAGAAGLLTAAHLPGPARLALAALACLLAVAVDLSRRLPTGRRQVDEDWLSRYRGWVYGGGFGFQLGLGVVTIVTSAATWAVLVLALLAGSLPAAVLLGATFGVVRALPVLALRRVHTHDELRAVARRLEARSSTAARATYAVLVSGGAALAAGAVMAA